MCTAHLGIIGPSKHDGVRKIWSEQLFFFFFFFVPGSEQSGRIKSRPWRYDKTSPVSEPNALS